MKYCPNCGKPHDDELNFCSGCGVRFQKTESIENPVAPTPTYTYENSPAANNEYFNPDYRVVLEQQPVKDEPSVGLAVLSFFIPIVGFILGIVHLCNHKSKSGKTYLFVSLVPFVLSILFSVIIGVMSAVADSTDTDNNSSSYSEEYKEENESSPFESFGSDNQDAEESNTKTKYGNDKVGYINLEGEWHNFVDVDVNSETMVQYTNSYGYLDKVGVESGEIITMNYYNGSKLTKKEKNEAAREMIDGIKSRTSEDAVQKISKNNKTKEYSSYCYYYETEDNYQMFTSIIISDKTDDIVYFAVESSKMDKDEFIKFVNETCRTHTFMGDDFSFRETSSV